MIANNVPLIDCLYPLSTLMFHNAFFEIKVVERTLLGITWETRLTKLEGSTGEHTDGWESYVQKILVRDHTCTLLGRRRRSAFLDIIA